MLLLAALFATGTILMAQGGPRGGQRNMDPKDRAERMTERMVKEYSLNETQKKELYALNLELAQKMTPPQKEKADKEVKKDAKAKGRKGQNARQGNADKSREDYDAKVKEIFTKEQYEAYTKQRAERQKRMDERRNRPQRTNN